MRVLRTGMTRYTSSQEHKRNKQCSALQTHYFIYNDQIEKGFGSNPSMDCEHDI